MAEPSSSPPTSPPTCPSPEVSAPSDQAPPLKLSKSPVIQSAPSSSPDPTYQIPDWSRKSPPVEPPSLASATAFLQRLSSSLSNISSLDISLLTICYTLRLLTSFPAPRKHVRPRALTRLLTSLPPLIKLLEDLRIRLRLVALIPIISSAFRTALSPPSNKVERTLAWAQVLSLGVFQAGENLAYLAEKGVISMAKEKVGKAWIWSSRAWALWTGLELTRLGRERQQQHSRPKKAAISENKAGGGASTDREARTERTDKINTNYNNNSNNNKKTYTNPTETTSAHHITEKIKTLIEPNNDPSFPSKTTALATQAQNFRQKTQEERVYWSKWWKNVAINAAYLPMTLHYSREKPIFGERTLAALGVMVAVMNLAT